MAEKKQMIIRLNKQLFNRFKQKCARKEMTMKSVIINAINEFLEKR